MSWKTVALRDVCNFQNGFAFKSNLFTEEGLPILRISNIQNQVIDINNLVYFNLESYKENLEKYIVEPQDLLIAMSGATTGKIGFNNTNQIFYLNQRVGNLKPKKVLNKKYLYYFLLTQAEKNLRISAGTAQPNLSTEQIRGILIPLPSISIQQKIVEKLDAIFSEIDRATAATEANIKNAEALFQSYLTEVFERGGEGWHNTTLGDYYDVRDGTHDSPKFYDEGYPLVTSKNLKNGEISFEKIQYINKQDYLSISQRSGVKKGDVLMAMIGTIGNPVVIETDAEFAIKNVALFKTNNKQSPHFLRYYLGSDYVIRKMEKDAKGATQKFVGLGYLRSFPIKIPSLDIQIKIVEELEEYEQNTKKLLSSYTLKFIQLIDLKQSILKQAFNGELVRE